MGCFYITLSLTCFGFIGMFAKFADLRGSKPSAVYTLAYGWCVLCGTLFVLFRDADFHVPIAVYAIGLPFGVASVIGGIVFLAGVRYGKSQRAGSSSTCRPRFQRSAHSLSTMSTSVRRGSRWWHWRSFRCSCYGKTSNPMRRSRFPPAHPRVRHEPLIRVAAPDAYRLCGERPPTIRVEDHGRKGAFGEVPLSISDFVVCRRHWSGMCPAMLCSQ
jgi:hypothetical protein